MPYERTTKKNLRELTVCQHIRTAHSIAKFYDVDEKVEVRFLELKKTIKLKNKAQIFCTKRTWDQRAENGYMLQIENAFHEEIDNIKDFSARNHEAICKYWLLLYLRNEYHLSNLQDIVLNHISGSDRTKEQEETLESKWGSVVREGGVVASRFTCGLLIQNRIDEGMDRCRGRKWGLLESEEGDFLVADSYDFPFIPIAPKLAFWPEEHDRKITKQELAGINLESIKQAKKYYFARRLSECPIAA